MATQVGRVFTDGACSGNPGGPGGWAAVFSLDQNNKQLKVLKGGDAQTTNNRMELLAVIMAMEKILTSKRIKCFEIYSDSAYVVNAINMQWIAKWKFAKWQTSKGDDVKNKDLWQRLDKAIHDARIKKIDVKFIKVKGHNGNPLNEYADTIARRQVLKQKGLQC